MKRFLAVILLLCVASAAHADAPSLSVANNTYQHGYYEKAAEEFQRLVDSGIATGDIYFNLGTAQLRAGRRGAAMLSFERALRIDPSDSDAAFNLAEAQKGNIDKIIGVSEEEPLMERFGSRVPLGLVGFLFVACWLFGNLALMVRWFRGSRADTAGWLGALATAVAIITAPVLAIGAWQRSHSTYAIVVSPETAVREGPAADFKSAFEVHEGLKVRIVRQESGFLRVRLANGIEGWVSEKDAPII